MCASIPVVINVDSNKSSAHIFDNLIKEIEKKYSIKDLEEGLKKYLDILRDELVFDYNGDIYDKNRLISFMQIIRYQLNKIEQNTQSRVEFHLAYYQRPSVGFLVGYIFESDGLIIYQNNPDKDKFDEIAKVDKRNYKTTVDKFEKFKVETVEDDNSDSVLLSIKASSHDIDMNSESLSKYKNIVSMYANHDGTIKLEEDWILYVREIFTVLNRLQTQYKSITIAHAMPESLAVLVGMAVGNYWNIEMTQFDKGEYLEVIKLDEIKCYF